MKEMQMDETTQVLGSDHSGFIEQTVDIVTAYVSNNSVPVAELPTLLSGVHAALTGLGAPSASAEPRAEKLTAAQIRKSITPDALISFLDGKPYKTLKRHLSGNGMTIQEYRERFGLPGDYPSTAANYSAQRSALAKSLGLGNQRRNAAAKAATADETVSEAPKARGRKKAAEPVAAPAQKPARAGKAKKAAAE
jgi:predicted transcriptional regulator